jgi:hypothetical protein
LIFFQISRNFESGFFVNKFRIWAFLKKLRNIEFEHFPNFNFFDFQYFKQNFTFNKFRFWQCLSQNIFRILRKNWIWSFFKFNHF